MRRILAAAIAATTALFAACDGGERPSVERAERPTRPVKGGVLRLGINKLPANGLDPAFARTLEQLLVVDQLFDTLTVHDPDTLVAASGLAERWESTPDLRQWDFRLRSGITFANGRAITAADVKFSLERVAAKATASPNADLLESVTGYTAFAIEGGAPELTGITTPEPDLVRINTDKPFAALPNLLGNPALGVVPREAVERAEGPAFGEEPVGSGPFNYRGRRGGTISLVRAAGSPALVDGIDLVQFEDPAGPYAAFEAGEVDWSRVPPEQVAAAADRYGREAFRPYVAELFYAFNLGNPKFADVRFREAIVRAIDRRAIIRAIYDDNVRPIDGVVVAGVPGHQADACKSKCDFDPARARALIREVFGDAPPPEINLDFDQNEVQDKVGNAIKANLAEVGVTVVLRPRSLEEYQDFAVSGQQELFRLGWIGTYPSPDAFLTPLFRTGSNSNLARFSVDTIDAQLDAARAEADPKKRIELFRAAEQAIMDQVPVVPIGQFEVQAVVATRVEGLDPLVTGTFDAAKVWLAPR